MARVFEVDGYLLNERHYFDKEAKLRTIYEVLIYDERDTFLKGSKVVSIFVKEDGETIENPKLFEPVIVGLTYFESQRDGSIKPYYRYVKRVEKGGK